MYDTGKFLRQLLGKNENPDQRSDGWRDAELFFADRIEHNKQFIKPHIEDGFNVLCDRYYFSTFGYQMTQGVNLNYLLDKTNFLVNNGVIEKPDLILFFDVKVETAIARLKEAQRKSVEKFETRDFLSDLKQNYVEIIKAVDENVVVINAEKSLPTVIDSALKEIKKILHHK
jgi:dTMP kinase